MCVRTGDKGNTTSVIYITFPHLYMTRTFYNSHVGVISERTHGEVAASIYYLKSQGPHFVPSGSLFT